jgi:predicted RNase H-like HicB family nuclease
MSAKTENSGLPNRLRLAFSLVIEKDGNSYHAYCPGLKGLHVDGATEKEALENAVKAAYVYVASVVHNGDPLPIGPHFSADPEEQLVTVPPGAMLRHIELQWPSTNTSGIS